MTVMHKWMTIRHNWQASMNDNYTQARHDRHLSMTIMQNWDVRFNDNHTQMTCLLMTIMQKWQKDVMTIVQKTTRITCHWQTYVIEVNMDRISDLIEPLWMTIRYDWTTCENEEVNKKQGRNRFPRKVWSRLNGNHNCQWQNRFLVNDNWDETAHYKLYSMRAGKSRLNENYNC